MGQHIGALDYLLPEEYVNTMKVLHNRSPQMPLEDIYSVLREELGQEVRNTNANCVGAYQMCRLNFSLRRFLPVLMRSLWAQPA